MTPVINIIIEISCLIASIFFLKNDLSKFSRLTIFYLTIVCLTEISGLIYIKTFHKSNAWLYNISIIFEAAYIAYGLYAALIAFTKKSSPIIFSFLGVFCLCYLIEISNHGFFKFNTVTLSVMSVLIIMISLYYFLLLQKDKNPINLKYHWQFWWVTGVLIYYFGGTVYNLCLYFLLDDIPKPYKLLVYVMIFLNLILYSSWAYSFLCRSRQQKLSGS